MWTTALNRYNNTTTNDTNKTTAESPLDGALDVRRRELPFEDDLRRENDEVLLFGILRAHVLAFQSADDGHIEPVHHVLGGGLARLFSDGLKLMVFENTGHGEITSLGLEPEKLGKDKTIHAPHTSERAHTNDKSSGYES